MEIIKESTLGCDKLSQVYRDMFNVIQPLLENDEKLKGMSPVDMSALGLYIGKFAEQEINSSVVQLMRQCCGIDMPLYYCKYCDDYSVRAVVETRHGRRIRLNERKSPKSNQDALKTIPLGDAYYALEAMKDESEGFLKEYKFLYSRKFLDAWRVLFDFRNRTAHTGELLSREELKRNLEQFKVFLDYMPNLFEIKKELAPDDYVDDLIPEPDSIDPRNDAQVEKEDRLPRIPLDVAQRYVETCERFNGDWHVENEQYFNDMNFLNDVVDKYDVNTVIFEGPDGKKGMKDILGNVLVPARYDGFDFVYNALMDPRSTIPAIQDGKWCIVKTDGSGEEIVAAVYDDIYFLRPWFPAYLYKKDGGSACGIILCDGTEFTEPIIDKFCEPTQSFFFQSGGLWGLWQYCDWIVPPIYDNIEVVGEFEDPLLFTLNGVTGYVRQGSCEFVPQSVVDAIEDEDERIDFMFDSCFICEQYDLD